MRSAIGEKSSRRVEIYPGHEEMKNKTIGDDLKTQKRNQPKKSLGFAKIFGSADFPEKRSLQFSHFSRFLVLILWPAQSLFIFLCLSVLFICVPIHSHSLSSFLSLSLCLSLSHTLNLSLCLCLSAGLYLSI